MARPHKPVDELRNNRVAVMLSEEELEAIDEWRFTNRVGSRGGAMRKMCAFAIAASKKEEK